MKTIIFTIIAMYLALRIIILLIDKWEEEDRSRKRSAAFEKRRVPKIPFRDKEIGFDEIANFRAKPVQANVTNSMQNESLNRNAGVGNIANNTKLTRNF